MIAKIANSNWPKAYAQYEGFKPLSGNALFAQMDHTRWARQRKSLAPAFGPGVVNAQFLSLRKYLIVRGPWPILPVGIRNSPVLAICESLGCCIGK